MSHSTAQYTVMVNIQVIQYGLLTVSPINKSQTAAEEPVTSKKMQPSSEEDK